jgi:hypothetical protein
MSGEVRMTDTSGLSFRVALFSFNTLFITQLASAK